LKNLAGIAESPSARMSPVLSASIACSHEYGVLSLKAMVSKCVRCMLEIVHNVSQESLTFEKETRQQWTHETKLWV
jgi:hypothetical protein